MLLLSCLFYFSWAMLCGSVSRAQTREYDNEKTYRSSKFLNWYKVGIRWDIFVNILMLQGLLDQMRILHSSVEITAISETHDIP